MANNAISCAVCCSTKRNASNRLRLYVGIDRILSCKQFQTHSLDTVQPSWVEFFRGVIGHDVRSHCFSAAATFSFAEATRGAQSYCLLQSGDIAGAAACRFHEIALH